MPSAQASFDLKRKVTFADSDRDARSSSMGLHPIDEDSDLENVPNQTEPAEKQTLKTSATPKRSENREKLPKSE